MGRIAKTQLAIRSSVGLAYAEQLHARAARDSHHWTSLTIGEELTGFAFQIKPITQQAPLVAISILDKHSEDTRARAG